MTDRKHPAWRSLASPDHPVRSPQPELATVTLLYFDDCPSWQTADQHLRALAGEMGIMIQHAEVASSEDAERLRFRGSPSTYIDGDDLFADADAPVRLSCRIYQTPQGSAGSPSADQLRSILAAR